MALSAADVRAALSISASLPSQTKKPTAGPSTKRPEGIPRELYALIGDSAPSLAAQLSKPRLKQKPNLSANSKVHWEWRPFSNIGRKDSLQLHHWVHVSGNENTDSAPYPFAKYNTPAFDYTYTSEEYNQYLEDQDWPRNETDYLFQLVREYDLRWYIIFDRYNFPGSTRSMEDMKDRYYSACRKLVRSRPCEDENSKNTQLAGLSFDKDREQMRKKYLQSLESRTQDQKAEEEALYVELKRLEQNERRFRREREELLRTLAGIDSGLPDTVEDDSPITNLVQDIKRKKKGLDIDTTTSTPGPSGIKRPLPKNTAHDAQHCITRVEPPSSAALVTKNAHTPAFLRSYKLATPKASVLAKVNDILKEVNINSSRLVMPTRENCAAFESVMEAASSVVEMKKQLDKIEYEFALAKERAGMTGKTLHARTASSAADAMDVDETVDNDMEEDGRAQSVMSARSARSRKKTRSGSLSSVDMSQPKRQRRT